MEDIKLDKIYSPEKVEEKWAAFWLGNDLFRAEASSDKPSFSMVIPPPNITGTLHLGHALNNTLQDILARYKRMTGHNVLWVPGIDHAGIATQNVVERQLHDEGKDRHTLGREKFIERVWQWKRESGGAIVGQLKRLGASCDWSRERFTMDEGLSGAVRKVFVSLYEEGLVYRGNYIINWCPRCHTALSDLEVEAEETEGKLYYLKYPTKEGGPAVTVATTRPETMLGDVAVAVNPEDERFSGLIGTTLLLPIVGREIPVISDDSVDMEFGTGAVKITPAHDFNDFEMAKRHSLDSIKIMDQNAVMNDECAELEGLDRFQARKAVVASFKKQGLLDRTEPHKMMLGSCYRCRTVVEPTLSKQWFVKTAPLAAPAIEAVEKGETRFVPKGWENTYFDWMRNIRDWCISRQIWWGHRIPAWYCKECEHINVGIDDPDMCEKCGGGLEQETDVLDTWFSSALWPFSTLGWPGETPELKSFYPTSTLSTSFDIIFFWVARMMMMGIKFMGKVPFDDVYIHALIRDADGQKMSKSKGNVIDPLIIMDKFGTDALRFTLSVLAAQGRDIKLGEDRVEVYRNFCNKIWNLARFTLMYMDEDGKVKDYADEDLNMADRWILERLSVCTEEVRTSIEGYRFDDAAKSLYRFVWHEFCDWYVELIKRDLRGEYGEERKLVALSVLVAVLGDALKLLHPIMPFITEEIWSYLPGSKGTSIMGEAFPEKVYEPSETGAAMEIVMNSVTAIRNLRGEVNVAPKAEVEIFCFTTDDAASAALSGGERYFKELARVGALTVSGGEERPEKAVSARIGGTGEGFAQVEIFMPIEGLIDVEAETARIDRELTKLCGELAGLEKKLSNESFVAKAPPEVVAKDRARRDSLVEEEGKLKAELERVAAL